MKPPSNEAAWGPLVRKKLRWLLACIFVGATTETRTSESKQLFGNKGSLREDPHIEATFMHEIQIADSSSTYSTRASSSNTIEGLETRQKSHYFGTRRDEMQSKG